MNDEMPHDDQLRELYRKLPADEPRAELDDAILAAARKRARETARLSLLRRVRWSVSLAAAAGLVLTLTLNRPSSDPELKRANDSAVQLTEFAQPAGAPPPPPSAPALTTAPTPPAVLEDGDARREDRPAAASPSKKPAPEEVNDQKQEAQPLAKDVEADRARLKADGASSLAKPKSEKPAAPEAKASASRPLASSGGATAPHGGEGGDGEPASTSPPVDVRSSMQSLGSIRGGDEAAAPAPPPPDGGAASDAAKSSRVARNTPAAPERDNAPSQGAKESFGENQRPCADEPPEAADRAMGAASATNDDVVACEATPAEPPAPREPWPFGLEPGLTPEEACRRVREALGRECRFRAGLVDMPLAPAVTIDRGRFAGRSASHLTMSLQRDKLWSIVLGFRAPDGSFTQESLNAPDPIRSTAPTPAPTAKE